MHERRVSHASKGYVEGAPPQPAAAGNHFPAGGGSRGERGKVAAGGDSCANLLPGGGGETCRGALPRGGILDERRRPVVGSTGNATTAVCGEKFRGDRRDCEAFISLFVELIWTAVDKVISVFGSMCVPFACFYQHEKKWFDKND